MEEWISVKDRLPEESGLYLTYGDIEFVPDHNDQPNTYKGIKIRVFLREYHNLEWDWRVTHWMPLPEPPKEG